MSYLDRLQEYVTLIAPKGDKFTPKWRGDKITATKKVAEFTYPGTDGTVVQDLGMAGFRWPMTLYFDDDPDVAQAKADNDLEAWRFLQALAQKGTDGRAIWSVTHPVYGTRKLQPLSFELDANPSESGGMSIVTTQWVEPIPSVSTKSLTEFAGQSAAALTTSINNSTSQYSAIADQTSADKTAALKNSWTNSMGDVMKTIGTANATVNNLQTQITGMIAMVTVPITSIAATFSTLMNLPGLIVGDVSSQISAFGAMLTGVFTGTFAPTTTAGRNSVATVEYFASTILAGMGNAVLNSTITTRAQAAQSIADLTAWLAYLRNQLDAYQSQFSGQRLDLQYFSMSKAYADALQAIALLQSYLQALTGLKAAKTYALTSGRSTLEIAMSEYGVPGQAWDDSLFDKFLAINNLHGTDILWLPAGRKVTVYL